MSREELSELNELQLVKAVQAGEREAFDQLVIRYQDRVIGLAYSLLDGNREEALDAAQEVFLKAYRRIDKFRGESKFYTWLYRITVNQCFDLRRKHKRRKGEISLDEPINDGDDAWHLQLADENQASAEMLVHEKELARVTLQAMDILPEKHRAVIILREVEDMSYQEIAETIGISQGTVMSRLHHARKKLHQILKPVMEARDWLFPGAARSESQGETS